MTEESEQIRKAEEKEKEEDRAKARENEKTLETIRNEIRSITTRIAVFEQERSKDPSRKAEDEAVRKFTTVEDIAQQLRGTLHPFRLLPIRGLS